MVSIRAPARGATRRRLPCPCLPEFQSAPPHGGRLAALRSVHIIEGFQSAPPHGGRLTHQRQGIHRVQVSIRAPARGATQEHDRGQAAHLVSIRAPARGATSTAPRIRSLGTGFNPRPRTGGDFVARETYLVAHVSIRAPARGATFTGEEVAPILEVSIRAPARGATFKHAAKKAKDYAFQSAPPHGGRPPPRSSPRSSTGFNPRPRTGGDQGDGPLARHRRVSIRAPARGATFFASPRPYFPTVSIRAPARGATSDAVSLISRFVFQSAPPHGGRPSPRVI